MPLYEYFCLNCRTTFDVLRPMRQADEPIRCQACESPKTRRVLSLFAAQTSNAADGHPSSSGCACGGACACGHHH